MADNKELKEELKERTGLDDAGVAAGHVSTRIRELKAKSARHTAALVELAAEQGIEVKRNDREGEADEQVEAKSTDKVSEMSTSEVEFQLKRGIGTRNHSDSVKGLDIMHVEETGKARTSDLVSQDDKETTKEWKERTGNQAVYIKQKGGIGD